MDRKQFEKNLSILLTFKGVEIDPQMSNILFNLVKNDFTDQEFGAICVDICKRCELYGKYPDPKLFYDRKKEREPKILIEEGTFFLDDTMQEYKPYLEGMSDEDVERIWKWIMKVKRGEFVNQSWIIERIKQFNDSTKVKRIDKPCDEVRMLVSGAIKKM